MSERERTFDDCCGVTGWIVRLLFELLYRVCRLAERQVSSRGALQVTRACLTFVRSFQQEVISMMCCRRMGRLCFLELLRVLAQDTTTVLGRHGRVPLSVTMAKTDFCEMSMSRRRVMSRCVSPFPYTPARGMLCKRSLSEEWLSNKRTSAYLVATLVRASRAPQRKSYAPNGEWPQAWRVSSCCGARARSAASRASAAAFVRVPTLFELQDRRE